MRTPIALTLLAALAAFAVEPATAQRDVSPRIDQLESKDELRAARQRDAQVKKKEKKKEGAKSDSGPKAPTY